MRRLYHRPVSTLPDSRPVARPAPRKRPAPSLGTLDGPAALHLPALDAMAPVNAAEAFRELIASAEGQSENVMIVDVLRNDLGRVCEPGSVHVPRLLSLHVGGGITWRSDPQAEWEETVAKARGPLGALGAVEVEG